MRNINEKVSVNTIKSALKKLLEKYGNILSITAHKNLRMRGQAFVAFEDEETARKAAEELNGTMLFNKRLDVSLAKTSSNSSIQNKIVAKEYEKYLEERNKQRQLIQEAKPKPEPKHTKAIKIDKEEIPPNKILLLVNLPSGVTEEELVAIFDKFKGFVQVRLVSVKNVAFIDYEDEKCAKTAKEALHTLKIRDTAITGNYAKK